MSEQLELFIGHPPGDEPGKTKIADATASSSWNVNFNNGNVNTNSPANNNYARPDLWRTRDCEATRMVHHTKEAAYYLCHERQR